ncbi:hypothetical protein CFO_g1044 [Ceratocystis platani]|uniref:Nephrocystin 3-like N-terminal domain-containing protein n=1 Tax=Ceratocystis fimbriata f. sp. platani TaxID=88771 RepID=A0A0F8B6X2_CERFI|nr:hypothetical protein CFO_g1044 [Ceratocystis platani]
MVRFLIYAQGDISYSKRAEKPDASRPGRKGMSFAHPRREKASRSQSPTAPLVMASSGKYVTHLSLSRSASRAVYMEENEHSSTEDFFEKIHGIDSSLEVSGKAGKMKMMTETEDIVKRLQAKYRDLVELLDEQDEELASLLEEKETEKEAASIDLEMTSDKGKLEAKMKRLMGRFKMHPAKSSPTPLNPENPALDPCELNGSEPQKATEKDKDSKLEKIRSCAVSMTQYLAGTLNTSAPYVGLAFGPAEICFKGAALLLQALIHVVEIPSKVNDIFIRCRQCIESIQLAGNRDVGELNMMLRDVGTDIFNSTLLYAYMETIIEVWKTLSQYAISWVRKLKIGVDQALGTDDQLQVLLDKLDAAEKATYSDMMFKSAVISARYMGILKEGLTRLTTEMRQMHGSVNQLTELFGERQAVDRKLAMALGFTSRETVDWYPTPESLGTLPPKDVRSSCQWVFEVEEVERLIADDNTDSPYILHLHGLKGTGKTTALLSLRDFIAGQRGDHVAWSAVSFFHQTCDADLAFDQSCFRSLAWQFIKQNSDLEHAILGAFSEANSQSMSVEDSRVVKVTKHTEADAHKAIRNFLNELVKTHHPPGPLTPDTLAEYEERLRLLFQHSGRSFSALNDYMNTLRKSSSMAIDKLGADVQSSAWAVSQQTQQETIKKLSPDERQELSLILAWLRFGLMPLRIQALSLLSDITLFSSGSHWTKMVRERINNKYSYFVQVDSHGIVGWQPDFNPEFLLREESTTGQPGSTSQAPLDPGVEDVYVRVLKALFPLDGDFERLGLKQALEDRKEFINFEDWARSVVSFDELSASEKNRYLMSAVTILSVFCRTTVEPRTQLLLPTRDLDVDAGANGSVDDELAIPQSKYQRLDGYPGHHHNEAIDQYNLALLKLTQEAKSLRGVVPYWLLSYVKETSTVRDYLVDHLVRDAVLSARYKRSQVDSSGDHVTYDDSVKPDLECPSRIIADTLVHLITEEVTSSIARCDETMDDALLKDIKLWTRLAVHNDSTISTVRSLLLLHNSVYTMDIYAELLKAMQTATEDWRILSQDYVLSMIADPDLYKILQHLTVNSTLSTYFLPIFNTIKSEIFSKNNIYSANLKHIVITAFNNLFTFRFPNASNIQESLSCVDNLLNNTYYGTQSLTDWQRHYLHLHKFTLTYLANLGSSSDLFEALGPVMSAAKANLSRGKIGNIVRNSCFQLWTHASTRHPNEPRLLELLENSLKVYQERPYSRSDIRRVAKMLTAIGDSRFSPNAWHIEDFKVKLPEILAETWPSVDHDREEESIRYLKSQRISKQDRVDLSKRWADYVADIRWRCFSNSSNLGDSDPIEIPTPEARPLDLQNTVTPLVDPLPSAVIANSPKVFATDAKAPNESLLPLADQSGRNEALKEAEGKSRGKSKEKEKEREKVGGKMKAEVKLFLNKFK